MEHYIVHFCFDCDEQHVVSLSACVGAAFELTFSPLAFDHLSPANYIIGKLVHSGENLELCIDGVLNLSGIGFRTNVQLNQPFQLPAYDKTVAAVVTELHGQPLAHQIASDGIVRTPVERTKIVRDSLKEFLKSLKLKRKLKLLTEVAEIDRELESNGAG